MRRITALFWMILWSAPIALAQNIRVPQEVANQFTRQFGRSEKVQWAASNDDNYEAEFNQNGILKTVVFSRTGQLIRIENPVAAHELPFPVTHTLASEYAGYELHQAFRVESLGRGVSFRVRIRTRNGSIELEVGNDGHIRRRVIVEYDDRAKHEDCDHDHHKHKHKDKHHHHPKHHHQHHCDHHHDCHDHDDD